MSSYPDVHMQSVLDHIRRYSNGSSSGGTGLQEPDHPESAFVNNSELIGSISPRPKSPMVASAISRRQSNDILMSDVAARRLSEAGVNRRPSAALVLTEDTDSFKIGDSVYVDGIKPGRIQFIGKNFSASQLLIGNWCILPGFKRLKYICSKRDLEVTETEISYM